MCAKFGCGPTVVSKKRGGGTDRQTKKTAALYNNNKKHLVDYHIVDYQPLPDNATSFLLDIQLSSTGHSPVINLF